MRIQLVECPCSREYDAGAHKLCPTCARPISEAKPANISGLDNIPQVEKEIQAATSKSLRMRELGLTAEKTSSEVFMRKIHFWVRLMGITVLIQVTGGLLILIIVALD